MSEEKREVSVTVHGESETPMRMKIKSGKFEMIIDEPENMGGSNRGQAPFRCCSCHWQVAST